MATLLGVCGMVIGALAAAGWVVAVADSAPNLSQLAPRDPHPPTEIFASDGTLLGYVQSKTVYDNVPGELLPQRLREATVAIEDRRFWQHGALDYQGILRAGIKDVFGGGSGIQGASTLTMQLVDNLYIPQSIRAHRDLKYKIVQAKLALQLAKRHSKTWILDSYLNDVPYGAVNGETAIGVGAASYSFFGRPVWRLDLAQMALLAGLPQAPTEYNPVVDPQLALQRRAEVLQAMVNSHYITQAWADAVQRQGLQIHPSGIYTSHQWPFVFDYAVEQLEQDLCPQDVKLALNDCPAITNGGLKVYTTINLRDEQDAVNAILAHEGGHIINNQPAAALASVDATNGHILALAQSAPYGTAPGTETTFDYPVQSERQTGSAFKVFALMTLIHDYDGDPNQTYYTSKFLPAGWLPAAPTWSVHTAEETYQGTISITKATIVSDNTVFAQLSADLNDQFEPAGWDKMDQIAYEMGIPKDTLHGYASEVLGGLDPGVTPLEMADADVTIADGGSHIPPTIIDHVRFPDGRTVNYGNPPRTQVFTAGETAEAISVLKQVITAGTGSPYTYYGCPAAGKTGTANDEDNAWFVGFSPRISTAVWVGFPQGEGPAFSMADFPGGGFGGPTAGPIWHDYMERASDGFCQDFPQVGDYWSGVPFLGLHSSAKSPSCPSNGSTPGNGTTPATGSAPGNGSAPGTPGSTAACPAPRRNKPAASGHGPPGGPPPAASGGAGV